MNKNNTKEVIKSIIIIIAMTALSMGMANMPEDTSVIQAINKLYSVVLMLLTYVVIKDI